MFKDLFKSVGIQFLENECVEGLTDFMVGKIRDKIRKEKQIEIDFLMVTGGIGYAGMYGIYIFNHVTGEYIDCGAFE